MSRGLLGNGCLELTEEVDSFGFGIGIELASAIHFVRDFRMLRGRFVHFLRYSHVGIVAGFPLLRILSSIHLSLKLA